jgi:hypothetical protein
MVIQVIQYYIAIVVRCVLGYRINNIAAVIADALHNLKSCILHIQDFLDLNTKYHKKFFIKNFLSNFLT